MSENLKIVVDDLGEVLLILVDEDGEEVVTLEECFTDGNDEFAPRE